VIGGFVVTHFINLIPEFTTVFIPQHISTRICHHLINMIFAMPQNLVKKRKRRVASCDNLFLLLHKIIEYNGWWGVKKPMKICSVYRLVVGVT